MIDWGTFASSAVIAAILRPAASYLIVRRFRNEDAASLARVREDLARETRRIDAERASLESKIQTQYTWVFQERAQAMSAVYQALLDAQDKFEDFGMSWGRLPGDQAGPKDKWLAARDAGDRFTKAFRTKRLPFPVNVAAALDGINRRFVATFNAYFRELHIAKGDEYLALGKMLEKGDLSFGDCAADNRNHRTRVSAAVRH